MNLILNSEELVEIKRRLVEIRDKIGPFKIDKDRDAK